MLKYRAIGLINKCYSLIGKEDLLWQTVAYKWVEAPLFSLSFSFSFQWYRNSLLSSNLLTTEGSLGHTWHPMKKNPAIWLNMSISNNQQKIRLCHAKPQRPPITMPYITKKLMRKFYANFRTDGTTNRNIWEQKLWVNNKVNNEVTRTNSTQQTDTYSKSTRKTIEKCFKYVQS